MDEIKVRSFQPSDQDEVKELVLSGLVEHWGRLDASKNPDLQDIRTSYAQGVFLVVVQGEEIIGTGALLPRTDRIAEIVRMSVTKRVRRMGVGRKLLDHLIIAARELGCEHVILETTATWDEVIAFYVAYGFRITHYQNGDVYFTLDLNT